IDLVRPVSFILFSLYCYGAPRDLHSFPTRRSSDLFRGHSDTEVLVEAISRWGVAETLSRLVGMFAFAVWDSRDRTLTLARDRLRSEEHTSELQSRENLVCRLLLEKKKTQQTKTQRN